MSAGNFFRGGVGRFARARGTSQFARAFNGELPRHFVTFPTRYFGELPIGGFAEQHSPLSGVLNAMRLGQEVSDIEEPDGSAEDPVQAASSAIDAMELISCLQREWSGTTIER